MGGIMVKISVNLDDGDAMVIDQLASSKRVGNKSDIVRRAIHEYCEKATQEQQGSSYAIDAAFGAFKEAPLDSYTIRKDSNESGRL